MPRDEPTRNKAKCIMERVAAKLGHDSLTWRVVPTSNKSLGKSAVAVEPHIEQWFLSAHGLKDNLETEQQVGGGFVSQCGGACRTGQRQLTVLLVVSSSSARRWQQLGGI